MLNESKKKSEIFTSMMSKKWKNNLNQVLIIMAFMIFPPHLKAYLSTMYNKDTVFDIMMFLGMFALSFISAYQSKIHRFSYIAFIITVSLVTLLLFGLLQLALYVGGY